MSAALENPHVPVGRTTRSERSLRQATACLLLVFAAVYEAAHQTSLGSITSANFWWHLRTGLWILENHSVPHTGIYSQSEQTRWLATSWLFDALSGAGYTLFDLRFAPMLLAFCKLLLAAVTFLLAGTSGKVWVAIGLSAVAQYILAGVPLGPVYGSILCFGFELLLLLEFRRSGRPRCLLWLPLLFLFWANLDLDFVYGVLVLVLFLAALLIEEFAQREAHIEQSVTGATYLRWRTAGTVLALCLSATVITPYFYRPYQVFFAVTTSAANRFLPEYHAISFRHPQDYLLMLLAMSAFLALGRRRSRDLFQAPLLIVSTMLSFYLYSYGWMAVLASLAIIGGAMRQHELPAEDSGSGREKLATAAVAVGIVMVACAVLIPRSRDQLLRKMRDCYPVAAADFIRDNHLPQPLFNAYVWGAFLVWYLPQDPVAIDGRVELYNDDGNIQYARFMRADFPYRMYPPISRARTILLERSCGLAQVLSGLPGFQTVFSDDLAIVLRHEPGERKPDRTSQ